MEKKSCEIGDVYGVLLPPRSWQEGKRSAEVAEV